MCHNGGMGETHTEPAKGRAPDPGQPGSDEPPPAGVYDAALLAQASAFYGQGPPSASAVAICEAMRRASDASECLAAITLLSSVGPRQVDYWERALENLDDDSMRRVVARAAALQKAMRSAG